MSSNIHLGSVAWILGASVCACMPNENVAGSNQGEIGGSRSTGGAATQLAASQPGSSSTVGGTATASTSTVLTVGGAPAGSATPKNTHDSTAQGGTALGGAATGGQGASTAGTAMSRGGSWSGGKVGTGGGATGVGVGGASSKASGGRSGNGTTALGGATTTGGTTALGGAPPTGGMPAQAGAGGISNGVTVQLDQSRQTIDGFGINDTWAPAMSDAEADALFNTTTGIGLSILRVGLGPDGNPMSSNIPADITKAKAKGVKTIIGSCWSPPANCKDNNSVNDGGHVLSSCYGSWSDTITKFAKDNGLYAMSIANEPDFASCGSAEPCNGNYPTTVFTADEMVAFLEVAGPKLKNAGIKVIAPEASEWIHQWSSESASGSEPGNKPSSDPLKCGFPASATKCPLGKGYDYGHAMYATAKAWSAVDIIGVHQYDTQKAEPWPADVPDKKPVWQTEMSGVKWWPEQGPSSDIKNGIAVAGWIHDALTVGEVTAWLWWWYKANNTDDNEGLILKNGTDTKRHYTFGNFSKFVRPGYSRVDVTGNGSADLLITAFKGTDGTVVVVAINKATTAVSVPITITGGTAPAAMTPNVTSASDNLKAGTAIPVSGGRFSATLAGQTVTTLVGK